MTKTFREAYNGWVELIHYHHYHNTDRDPEELEIEKVGRGGFTPKVRSHTEAEIERGRPTLPDGTRERVLFGIELTDDAHKLAELVGAFTPGDE